MELMFQKAMLPCLRQVKREVQTYEGTQELRMPDGYPDIEKVIGTWGQVLLRSKEWRDGSMVVSGGVMTWILYQPEGEGSIPQTVEAWIPFQMRWDLPQTQRDGIIRVIPMLRSVDARTTSARKILARATVAIMGEAYLQDETQAYSPAELPNDVQLLRNTYPLLLPREAGEKTFDMEEELSLPGSCPAMDHIVRFSLQPVLIDQKVMSGKLVFRGSAIVHLVYLSDQGHICTWDFDVPFSRYTELDDVYEQDAQSNMVMAVTSLELQPDADGKLCLKAGLTGQYVIYDRTMLEVGQDAYSTQRPIEHKMESLELPAVLRMQDQMAAFDHKLALENGKIVDFAFYPDQPQIQLDGTSANVLLSGVFHILICDEHQRLSGMTQRWNDNWELQLPEQVNSDVVIALGGIPQQSEMGSEATIHIDMQLNQVSTIQEGIPMIASLELGTECEPNYDRPCLVLRRAGKNTLWEIAKHNGSTVEKIRCVNSLESEPDPDRMLLIPIL